MKSICTDTTLASISSTRLRRCHLLAGRSRSNHQCKFILLSWVKLVDWISHLARDHRNFICDAHDFPSSSRDFRTWSLATGSNTYKLLKVSGDGEGRRPGLHIDDVTWQILSRFKWRKRKKKEREKLGQQYSSRCCCSTCQ